MLTFRAMSDRAEWRCVAADVAPGQTKKFRLEDDGRRVHGFVVNHDGEFHAFVNSCPHVGTPLDLWENEFMTEDLRRIVCATHGAIFDPADGRCLAGPCAGDALTPLVTRRDGDDVVVEAPSRI